MKHIKYFNSMDEFKSNAESIPTPCVCVTENDGGQMCSYRASDDKEFSHFQGGEKVEVSLDLYEAIDLGLPSGRLWASCNVGATKPEEAGLYFAWGATEGCGSDTTDGKVFELPSAYDAQKGYPEGGDIPAVLDAEHDAAAVNMGGEWHMPDNEDFEELLTNTTNTWTTVNGVNGTLFTSKSNGETLFIPAAGYRSSSELSDVGRYGYVWSRSLFSDYTGFAWNLYFSEGCDADLNDRFNGYSVRGVK